MEMQLGTMSLDGGAPEPIDVQKITDHLDKKLGGGRSGGGAKGSANGKGRAAASPTPTPDTGGIAADRLRSIVDRIERLEEERKALGNDIKDIYTEAASAGFEVKVLRQLIRIRKQEPDVIEEQETLLDVYRRALGM